MPPTETGFKAILDALSSHEVEFVVVGGVCAVLQGVPVTTFDLDVVHRRTPENIERLLRALEALEAVSRLDRRRLRPNSSHLNSNGHQLLQTRFGALDVLSTLIDGLDYDALLPHTTLLTLWGHPTRVLTLQRLLEIKERTGRPKDLAMLPLIQNTLHEREALADADTQE